MGSAAKNLTNGQDEEICGNRNTGLLKLLALAFMLCDHVGVLFFPQVRELRVIGRMALPLYAWCMVVGCVKTRNPYRYALRILILAVVCQPLYMMTLRHGWDYLNIMFLLFFGVISITAIRYTRYGSAIWVPLLCLCFLCVYRVDYGWAGYLFMLVLYFARGTRLGLAAAYMAYALFWGTRSTPVAKLFGCTIPLVGLDQQTPVASLFRLQGMIWLSLPLILWQSKGQLRMPRWLGYLLYPLHLVLLMLIRLMMGTPFQNMIGFLKF